MAIETRSGNLDRPQKNWSAWAPLDQGARTVSPLRDSCSIGSISTPGPQGTSPGIARDRNRLHGEERSANHRRDRHHSSQLPLPGSHAAAYSNQYDHAHTAWTAQTCQRAFHLARRDCVKPIDELFKGQHRRRWSRTTRMTMTYLYGAIRGVHEKEWKLLRDKLKEKYLSWESNTFPDGEYIIRVTASDSQTIRPTGAQGEYRERAIHHRQHRSADTGLAGQDPARNDGPMARTRRSQCDR